LKASDNSGAFPFLLPFALSSTKPDITWIRAIDAFCSGNRDFAHWNLCGIQHNAELFEKYAALVMAQDMGKDE